MDEFRSFMLVITGLVISIGTSILVMMYGWGLEPKSWWWILGVYFFGQILAQLFAKAATKG